MSSTWATKPPGIVDLTGMRYGAIEVIQMAQSNPLRWRVKCTKPYCGTEWAELHSKIVSGGLRCANLGCQLGRLEAPKLSRWERELNGIETTEQEPVKAPEIAPEDYQLYRNGSKN